MEMDAYFVIDSGHVVNFFIIRPPTVTEEKFAKSKLYQISGKDFKEYLTNWYTFCIDW